MNKAELIGQRDRYHLEAQLLRGELRAAIAQRDALAETLLAMRARYCLANRLGSYCLPSDDGLATSHDPVCAEAQQALRLVESKP